MWKDCRSRFGADGPFLFSRFSIADAMYAPVASRLRTYVADLGEFGDDGTAAAYIDAVFALPAMEEWAQGAREEMAAR
jgi:glutathione S-transferase